MFCLILSGAQNHAEVKDAIYWAPLNSVSSQWLREADSETETSVQGVD